jgi:signal transduction histidine kinase
MRLFFPARIGLAPPVTRIRRLPHVARLALAVLLVSAGYYAGGYFGLSVRFPPSGISIIWPPNAILLAALLLAPPRTWGWYLLAALPTHLHLVANFQPGVPASVMLSQFAGNGLQAVVGALAVRRYAGAPPRFDSLRSATVFIVLAGIVAPAVVSALSAYLFVLTGWAADYGLAWRQRFLTNVVPTLTVTPLIVLTVEGGIARIRRASSRRHAEFGLLAVALLAVGIPVFGWWQPGPGILPALLYAPLPLLLWAAVRFGAGGACLALLVVAFLSLSNAFDGRGPFAVLSPAENVLSLQIFLIAIAIPVMFLAAVVEERRRTEESLRRVQADLTHAARVTVMGQLVASIAHEINQPLAAIVTNAKTSLRRIAAGSLDTQELREVLQDVADDGNRASEVIQQIRGLVTKSPIQTAPLRLNTIIQEIIALVLGELMRHRVSLRTELADDLPPVLGDRVQLQQVLLNLIMNSIEAMREVDNRSRELTVQSRADGTGSVIVAVGDSGPGLGPGDPDVIFNAFYTTKPGGMGMGLSLSRSIVEAHGGRLWATSHESRGATVQFSLPIHHHKARAAS